ncbi:MAG: 4-(cytidine 5'-diphospho)-2-C-methyl-D-erythritol kinase [Pseudohongiellaceae bacterium]|nr:4-(cytidine 5'-diphospho)-2-C-methyl-D-erythritol kinase [Pseudohongiellaceae bacterium]
MNHLCISAPAKLNLFLHITGQREDGYHELQSVFQLIGLYDELEFVLSETPDITLACQQAELAGPDNLIIRAAKALQAHTACHQGANISLQKNIPTGAGLGGGSSDAASTLIALNELWQLGLSREDLANIGLKLGADVPVFVHGRNAWAEGIGEKLSPMSLPAQWFLVINPGCHVSTKEIFSHQELTRNSTAIKMAAFLARQTRNDCENIVRKLYPEVDQALVWLSKRATARMTGTGASVFAPFATEAEATAVLAQLPKKWKGFVAQGLDNSPLPKNAC